MIRSDDRRCSARCARDARQRQQRQRPGQARLAWALPLPLLLTLLCGCTLHETIDHSAPAPAEDLGSARPSDASPDSPPGPQPSDEPWPDPYAPGALNVSPLSQGVVIDGDLYQGVFSDGSPYQGVMGQRLVLRAQDIPEPWLLAALLAAKLLRRSGLQASPHWILALAVKAALLRCESPGPPGQTCYGLSPGAYTLLDELWPEVRDARPASTRWEGDPARVAWALAHYVLAIDAMAHRDHPAPHTFWAQHPQRDARLRHWTIALNQSPWWSGFARVFEGCAQRPVEDCMQESPGVPSRFLQDHSRAVLTYTAALDAQPPYQGQISWAQLRAFAQGLQPLFPSLELDALLDAQRAALGPGPLRLDGDVMTLLDALVWALPWPVASRGELIARLCAAYHIQAPRCPSDSR